jgi:hypothetical protein
MTIHKSVIVCGVIFSLAVAGCATTDQKTFHQYQPVVNATGGAGELFLALAGEIPKVRRKGARPTVRMSVTSKWVVVTEKTDSGKKLGIIVTPLASDKLLGDALTQELNAAGFEMRLVNTLPKDVGKGIYLSSVSVDVERIKGLFDVEGTCNVNMSLDLWRNGAKVKRLSYTASYSDSAVFDQDLLLQTILRESLQTLMKQAVPDIIRELDNPT